MERTAEQVVECSVFRQLEKTGVPSMVECQDDSVVKTVFSQLGADMVSPSEWEKRLEALPETKNVQPEVLSPIDSDVDGQDSRIGTVRFVAYNPKAGESDIGGDTLQEPSFFSGGEAVGFSVVPLVAECSSSQILDLVAEKGVHMQLGDVQTLPSACNRRVIVQYKSPGFCLADKASMKLPGVFVGIARRM
ncbi:hypothetical protein HPB51_012989 [Rhipicephalus microplus]|uniref:Uncharacterized protein n=1 Tax=Rhipicephalus microplus TaxID=6941 RepID=A0A9J6F2F8_RHIMP|nr:hypothetical protein HPB51_012989 [Rhipicephalus microplus]